MEIFKLKESFGFMKYAKRFGLLSLILVLGSWFLIFTKGFNYGIDFAGGTLIQVKYEQKAPIDDIRRVLDATKTFQGAQVTNFGNDEEVVIKIKKVSSDITNDASDEIKKVLHTTGKFDIRRVDMVGAKVGSELQEKGMMALILAVIGILIYVSYQFEWRFAVASVLALVHDVSIALGAIALLSIEVNLDILAAILTLLGYSINDTIIVFDRIRDSIRRTKHTNLSALIDESVTMTLSRTTLTSLTVFIVVLFLYLFGGEIISGFSLTLLIGVIVGTYSSIFIASPLSQWLGFSIEKFRSKEAEKLKREKEKERMRSMYEQGTL